MNVLAIERQRRFAAQIVEPSAETVLEAGDILFVDFKEPPAGLDESVSTLRPIRIAHVG